MRSIGFSILASVLFVHAAPAQTASYTYFGVGCSFPTLTAIGLPTLGGSFAVQTQSSYGGTVFSGWSSSVLLTGFSNQTWNGVTLPYSLPNLNPCGALLVSPDVFVTVPSGIAGTLVPLAFSVPNDA
ncbi:MAG TPA: hypothetical protein VKF62_04620, partial [Planctomycetota bacterium]|nr:hypothetical protein [Planctomycetota bacterium]